MTTIRDRGLEKELEYSASRSGGPGGQHANKVSSKVELRFDVKGSELLREDEKAKLREKLGNRITTEGELIITAQESRSQHVNKEIVTRKFFELLQDAMKPRKRRKKTKPGYAAKQKRLKKKKEHSLKKLNRKPPRIE
jgi:ribosome-associated protein